MENISIGLDVGGTFVKGALLENNQSKDYTDVHYYESKSNETKNNIVDNFIFIINDLLFGIDSLQQVSQIGLAFPGPFDYENGISQIQGLRKFDAIYGINLKKELKEKLILSNPRLFENTYIYFLNDAEAFAWGENEYSKKIKGAYFTLGTGLGSTFIEKKNLVTGKYLIPQSGMIYDIPFKDGSIDEYLCEKGLLELSKKNGFEDLTGEELFYQAESGVSQALVTLNQFGNMIGQAIKPFIDEMKPDEIVFGGQVSKSFKFFELGISEVLFSNTNEQIDMRESINTTMRTLEGLNKK